MASPEVPVTVTFTLSQGEVTRALRSVYLRTRTTIVWLAIGGCSLLLGGVLVAVGGVEPSIIGAFAALGVYSLALIAFLLVRGPSRAWRKQAPFRGEQTLTFSDDAVEMRGPVSESRGQWRIFKASHETEECYLLEFATRRAFTIVPRRVFTEPVTEDRFRQLLMRHTRARLGP